MRGPRSCCRATEPAVQACAPAQHHCAPPPPPAACVQVQGSGAPSTVCARSGRLMGGACRASGENGEMFCGLCRPSSPMRKGLLVQSTCCQTARTYSPHETATKQPAQTARPHIRPHSNGRNCCGGWRTCCMGAPTFPGARMLLLLNSR